MYLIKSHLIKLIITLINIYVKGILEYWLYQKSSKLGLDILDNMFYNKKCQSNVSIRSPYNRIVMSEL